MTSVTPLSGGSTARGKTSVPGSGVQRRGTFTQGEITSQRGVTSSGRSAAGDGWMGGGSSIPPPPPPVSAHIGLHAADQKRFDLISIQSYRRATISMSRFFCSC